MNANEFIEKTKLTFSCLTDNGVFSRRDMERAVEILIGLQAENKRLKQRIDNKQGVINFRTSYLETERKTVKFLQAKVTRLEDERADWIRRYNDKAVKLQTAQTEVNRLEEQKQSLAYSKKGE